MAGARFSDGRHHDRKLRAAVVVDGAQATRPRGPDRLGATRPVLVQHGAQRLDHVHKTALDPVPEHDFIAHENLKNRNMSRVPAPKPDPDKPGGFMPNGTSVKAELNRSIADAGWWVFLQTTTGFLRGCPDLRLSTGRNRVPAEQGRGSWIAIGAIRCPSRVA
ncbi:hypothetical protein ACWGQ5_48765 [Streptomyces sp. NPDC055722]